MNNHLKGLTIEQKLAYEQYRREVNACQDLTRLRGLVLDLLVLNFNQNNLFKDLLKGN